MQRTRWPLAALAAVALVAALAGPAAAVPVPFEDGFETTPNGAYPSTSGWISLSLGRSAYVSNEAAFEGLQSFRLDAFPWLARMDCIFLDTVPDFLSYQAAVRVHPTSGLVGLVGFMSTYNSSALLWNCFRVDGRAGRITFVGADGVTVDLGPYQRGNWCTLRADLDFAAATPTADLWRDGALVAVGVPIHPRSFTSATAGPVTLDRWGVAADSYFNFGGWSNVVYFDSIALWEPEPVADAILLVDIDVKPGSDTNPINLGARGLLPIAIFGADDFDVTEIDLPTVEFAGAPIAIRGPRYLANLDDLDEDGRPDLVVHIEIQRIDRAQLADGLGWLTGLTLSGQPFAGSDQVTIVPARPLLLPSRH